MDIKLKNIKYAAGTKAVAVILIWLCFLSAMGSWAFILMNEQVVNSNSYYDTNSFKNEFSRLIHNTVEVNIKLKSVESINASSESEEVKSKNLARYYSIIDRLSDTVNYLYYIKNSSTGEVITNITASQPVVFIKKQPASVYICESKWATEYNLYVYKYSINEMLKGTDYEIYAAIQGSLKPGDFFYDDFMSYSRIKAVAVYIYPLLITSLVVLVIAAVYLAYVAGRKEKNGDIVFLTVDRIYTDIHSLLVLAAAILSILLVSENLNPDSFSSWIATFFILGVDAFIGISYVLSMIRQFKAGRLFKNSLIFNFVRLCFGGKLFRGSIILFLLGYGLINGILFDIGVDILHGHQEPVFTGLLIIFNIAAIYFSAKFLLSLSQIMKAVKEISLGNLDYTLNGSEISVTFSSMASDIKNIQGGLKKAVAEAVKGERMKTELITNVSHDLKTPLTSIVNYVDLLKKEDLNNQKAEEYVCVLEEKSARLKQLIEDLIEASKASSGNLNVNAEKVDLHELVMQACGEYEEKIKKAELDIRISAEEKNIYIYADGKYMWRIVENLLSNVIKYSMPHSRVYVDLTRGSKFGFLTIKNISDFPLDISPEQLTERFVRGDVSRTTEGSGLGLSIARSLTTLQGGGFKIDIDGDLFKVSIEMPLWMEMDK